ncbi:hypothetical protein F2P79_003595 [Pimephales promelas]|nr:hypothetical protein F2P79_003595 [Pimephales promelas]
MLSGHDPLNSPSTKIFRLHLDDGNEEPNVKLTNSKNNVCCFHCFQLVFCRRKSLLLTSQPFSEEVVYYLICPWYRRAQALQKDKPPHRWNHHSFTGMSQGDLKERNMGPNIFGCCAVGHGKMVLQEHWASELHRSLCSAPQPAAGDSDQTFDTARNGRKFKNINNIALAQLKRSSSADLSSGLIIPVTAPNKHE